MITLNYCTLPTMNLCKPLYTSPRMEIIHHVTLFLPSALFQYCLVPLLSYSGTIYYNTTETCSDTSYQSGTNAKVI
jgi:hypothetical protein